MEYIKCNYNKIIAPQEFNALYIIHYIKVIYCKDSKQTVVLNPFH